MCFFFQAVEEYVFTPANKDRSDVPNVLYIVINGNYSDDDYTALIAAFNLRVSLDVVIYVIGINANEDQVRILSSAPQLPNKQYFMVDDENDLELVIRPLLEMGCTPVPPTKPTQPPVTSVTPSLSIFRIFLKIH